jgi:hypothetical protein
MMVRRIPWLASMVAIAALPAACTDMAGSALPTGDHAIRTYIGVQGVDEARDDNLGAAQQTCGGGVVLVDETSGTDGRGRYVELIYGCPVR